jgi:3-oxoacyl-[acyl-carrier protein] reductase
VSRTALILGASGTIGGRVAQELIARGYHVGLHYHTRAERCDALTADALARGLNAKSYPADFNDPAAPTALAQTFMKDFTTIDALVCAAGIVADAPLLTLKDADLRAVMNVDLRAVFLILKALSRQFMKQKSGTIIALSSHAGVSGRAGGSAYAMAHSGLQSLIKSVAREWGTFGVRANAVLPPFVADSAMGRSASPEFAAAVKLKRALKTDTDGAATVAQFIAGLLETPSVSGQVLSCDSRVLL